MENARKPFTYFTHSMSWRRASISRIVARNIGEDAHFDILNDPDSIAWTKSDGKDLVVGQVVFFSKEAFEKFADEMKKRY